MKRFLQKFILVGFGFFFAFLVLEIGVRVSIGRTPSFYAANPINNLTTLNPGAEGFWKKSCFKTYLKINSLGWRDDEFTEEKPQGTFRTVVLGDSYVEAFQVPLEATFHKKLEEKIQQDGIKNEVLALGKSGNGLFYDYLYLKNFGARYKPDLVILMFTSLNDVRDDSLEITTKYIKASGDIVASQKFFPLIENGALERYRDQKFVWYEKYAKPLLKKSALLSFLYPKSLEVFKKIRNAQRVQNNSLAQSLLLNVDIEIFLKQYDEMWESAWKMEKIIVENIKNLAEEIKAPLLIVSVPEALRVEHPESLDEKIYDLGKPERLMKNIADVFRIPFLDLVPLFRKHFEQTGEQLSIPCDGHWNETGHGLAAEAIYSFLQERGYIRQKQ